MILQWKSLALAESHYEIMEKLSKIKEENKNLKKEIHEVNQLNAKLEQDLVNVNGIYQKFQHEIYEDKRFDMSKRGKMLCMYFVVHKKCQMHNSNSCPFAHSIAEVKAANSKIGGGTFYKSAPCKEFQNGNCKFGYFEDVEGGAPTNWCGRIHQPLPISEKEKNPYNYIASFPSLLGSI